MKLKGKLLDLIFRRITPEYILKEIKNRITESDYKFEQKNWKEPFLNFAETTLSEYSEDEQILLFEQLEGVIQKEAQLEKIIPTSLQLLVNFAKKTLVVNNDEILCKIDKVLDWRDVYLRLSQNTVVCTYLAWCDLKNHEKKRVNFAWPAILKTNSRVLQGLLDEGIAENHCHLGGSTQSFDLTWIEMMNNVEELPGILEAFEPGLNANLTRGPKDNVLPISERIELAALIRTILFRVIHRKEFTNYYGECSGKFWGRNAFEREYIKSFSPNSEIRSVVEQLKHSYGVKIRYPNNSSPVCVDYALEKEVYNSIKDEAYRILAGERYFLYRCSRAVFCNEFTNIEKELFLLYQQIKISFRGEMIQLNEQVGFKNFSNYQDRKNTGWKGKLPYEYEALRMSLSGAFSVDNHSTVEARFGPGKTAKENYVSIKNTDIAKFLGDGTEEFDFNNLEKLSKEKYFYVLHVSKRKDNSLKEKGNGFNLVCRDNELRVKVKKQAVAIAQGLSQYPYLRTRIRGIDACSNEIGCRPEVFATAFRYLRNFSVEEFVPDDRPFFDKANHKLAATYHAGEDFLDICDGLRAIDETIYHFNYVRGDRLGHALALGIDPKTHYNNKRNVIITTKQSRLDDLVWVLYRSAELNVEMELNLRTELEVEAKRLFEEIFGKAMRRNRWEVFLSEYYSSMKLRGDEPYHYSSIEYENDENYLDGYSRYSINGERKELSQLRNNPKIAGINYYYYFGSDEKCVGAETIRVNINNRYITLMYNMQEAMQNYLERNGIIIECNPTSNVLIGTFREYDKHPIFRFNNEFLCGGLETKKMHVCMNTDDLGVFDTSLEFEYALIYQTLREMVDEKDEPIYSESDIMKYLRNIRNLSESAVFQGVSVKKADFYY